jgi:hypothetical protein
MITHPADQLAFDKAMVTQPVWNRFNTAADALNLTGVFVTGPNHRTDPEFGLRGSGL